MMNHQAHNEDFYKTIRENRMLMYNKPKRYYNRDEQKGSAFKFLFLIETIVFILLMAVAGTGMAQSTMQNSAPMNLSGSQPEVNIHNYNTVYNSGKVFV